MSSDSSAQLRVRLALFSSALITSTALGGWSVLVAQTSEASLTDSITPTVTLTEDLTSSIEAAPDLILATTGETIPVTLSISCRSASEGLLVDFGDGSDVVLGSPCPSSLNHTYTQAGTYPVVVTRGEQVVFKTTIAPTNPLLPTKRSQVNQSTATTLLLTLLTAFLLSGLVSYLILRPPYGRPVW
ncbi:hypothetical protein HY524_00015 [Candidatus Berkelbacteria bacterium]|nr:hypothetical protein [Candidatus Berkelbacteria bacterium]